MTQQEVTRMKWTTAHLQILKKIYQQQNLKGKKNLWNRITERIHTAIYPAKRQAIQYKWKNFCKIVPKKQNKLSKNKQLIQLILNLVPFVGYKELSKMSQFEGASQSNLKNIFYSNMRSMAKFLKEKIKISQSIIEISNMLSNRQFLKLLKQKCYDFINFRRTINKYKILTKQKRLYNIQDQIKILQLKQSISMSYYFIRNIYLYHQDKLKRKSSFQISNLNTDLQSNKQGSKTKLLSGQIIVPQKNIYPQKKYREIEAKSRDLMPVELNFLNSQDQQWQFSFFESQGNQQYKIQEFFSDF